MCKLDKRNNTEDHVQHAHVVSQNDLIYRSKKRKKGRMRKEVQVEIDAEGARGRMKRWVKRRRWRRLCGNACRSSDGRQQLYGPLLYGMFLEYRARRSIRFANQGECVSLCVCVFVFGCV